MRQILEYLGKFIDEFHKFDPWRKAELAGKPVKKQCKTKKKGAGQGALESLSKYEEGCTLKRGSLIGYLAWVNSG
jgi:hypothetical protein